MKLPSVISQSQNPTLWENLSSSSPIISSTTDVGCDVLVFVGGATAGWDALGGGTNVGTEVVFCNRLLRIPLLSRSAVGAAVPETAGRAEVAPPPTVAGLSPPPPFSILVAVGKVGAGAVPFVLLAAGGGTNTDGAADGTVLGDPVGAAVGRLVYERTSLRSTNWQVASRHMDNKNPTNE